MLRSDLRKNVPYAVVTARNFRPGERPHEGDVRPALLMDEPSVPIPVTLPDGEVRNLPATSYAPRSPVAIAYLRPGASLTVPQFIGVDIRLRHVFSTLGPTLLAHPSDDARRRDFARLDEERAARAEAAQARGLNTRPTPSSSTLSAQYERYRDVVDSCVFTRLPPYAILSTWARYLDAQVNKAVMELLLADSSQEDPEVEPDSVQAIRLFAERGVAIDPSRTFADEIVVKYEELFAAFGRLPRAETDPSSETL